jgi:hypothetical protein
MVERKAPWRQPHEFTNLRMAMERANGSARIDDDTEQLRAERCLRDSTG